jgi:antitoxin (DNA-binding transcriptional repressor) of toxin-antitoxin stability system
MITVGVRDLKNQLSQYLKYVKNGEKVIITEHDRIIAELRGPQNEERLSSIEEKLAQLSKEGLIIPAKRKNSCAGLPVIEKNLNWERAYDEIRAERT